MAKKDVPAPADTLPVPQELITRRIYVIRGQKVMLDSDLAELYQVETKALNRQVKRNPARFPEDFMFQLTVEEAKSLRYQFGTSNESRGGRRYLPYAFTEQGVAMLATVLNSDRAARMSILIIRAFVRLRELLATHKALAEKIEKLEHTQKQHGTALVGLIQDVHRLKNPPQTRAIGFITRSTPKKSKL